MWQRLNLDADEAEFTLKLQPQQLIHVRLVDMEGLPAIQEGPTSPLGCTGLYQKHCYAEDGANQSGYEYCPSDASEPAVLSPLMASDRPNKN